MASEAAGILDNDDWEQNHNGVNLDPTSTILPQFWRVKPSRDFYRDLFPPVSFALPRLYRRRERTLHSTAYLDGLRGFAALLVYLHHHELWVHDYHGLEQNKIFENAFGYDGEYSFAAFPGVRTFFSGGHYAVAVFFVLSGYVLSIKPLRLIEGENLPELTIHLSSAFFRRWFRLFLPLAIVLFVHAMSSHVFGVWIPGGEMQSTLLNEIWNFYAEFKNFSFIYNCGGKPWMSYNVHVWSIPVEMKGSMVIFATAIALARCPRPTRLACLAALVVYFLYIADGWYCAMFVAGMLLCNLDLLLQSTDSLPRWIERLEPYKTFICYHLLVVSVYLGGVPGQNADVAQLSKNRGWYYLAMLKPQAVFDYKWFYLFWAATLLVGIVAHIRWLKRFFETSFCQYLGRVSYALYLVHGPVLWTVGERLYTAVGWVGPEQLQHLPHWADKLKLPRTGPLGLEISFLVPQLVLLPLTLGVASFVTRVVDKPCVRFASWLYTSTLSKGPGRPAKGLS
jgi:peptidoglycan/LPS O-acetylase OafA/YrhL